MRRSLYFSRADAVEVREEDIPVPSKGKVLVRTEVSALSAGTEMLIYHGQVKEGTVLDKTIADLSGDLRYPFKYGYATVGRVLALGAGVDAGWFGKKVFSFHPHESHFSAYTDALLIIPDEVGFEEAVLLPSVETALSLVMDGRPIYGEEVIVLGQGMIGLLTTSLLSLMPLSSLITVDRIAARREMSMKMGASAVFPDAGAPELVKRMSGGRKADLTYELTGNPEMLAATLSLTGFEGRIIVGSWYGEKRANICFGEEFHRNRLQIMSSQVSSISPSLSGRWDKDRRIGMAWEMLKRIRPGRLITHRFDICDAAKAYELLDRHQDDAFQVVLTYRGE